MGKISFNGNSYETLTEENLLDTFLRSGVIVPFSCRNGICHSCIHRCIRGKLSKKWQTGLKESLIRKRYFLLCKCIPQSDMVIESPREADMLTRAVVYKKEFFTKDICRLLLEPASDIYYHAGQFINLHHPNGEVRSYSLASVPHEDCFLELHIKRVENGLMSQWIFNDLEQNDELEFHGPSGKSYYTSGNENQNLLFIATGTGLAPAIGIARDALLSGHQGDIHLYHGNRSRNTVYLQHVLSELEKSYSNFFVTIYVMDIEKNSKLLSEKVTEIAFNRHKNLKNWRVFLSGSPEMIKIAETKSFRQGVNRQDIYSDPFSPSKLPQPETDGTYSHRKIERLNYPEPDADLWCALEDGILLRRILQDFYTRVYDDAFLSPFFENVTKARLIEKAYSFSYQIITGKKVYFGDRPKNAHHWMVISNELFDYREKLMATVLREHNLSEIMINKWRAIDEYFRSDIVKDEPIAKVIGGLELPMDGFEVTTIDVSSICDGCEEEIIEGETVRYHLRLGLTYCKNCIRETRK